MRLPKGCETEYGWELAGWLAQQVQGLARQAWQPVAFPQTHIKVQGENQLHKVVI